MSDPPDEDLVPISVRLGEVVPPEDPEDWTQPLTWMAALGMLLGPLVAFAWFGVAPPVAADRPLAGTWLLAVALALGATITGATQQGWLRAATATAATALFAALVIVIAGAALAGERQVGEASPTLAQAFGAALAGLAGAVASTPVAARLASVGRRWPRVVAPGAVACGVAILVVRFVFGTAPV
jgi:hypothetical protein